jgi:hypothetical protein
VSASGLPRAPAGLKKPGRALWRSIVREYELNPAEVATLAHACRLSDECARLEELLDGAPSLEVAGSQGQARVHPAVAELRAHRLAIKQLLAALGIPSDTDDAVVSRSSAGRALAMRRWGVG